MAITKKPKVSKIKQLILMLLNGKVSKKDAAKKLKTSDEYIKKMASRLRAKGFSVKSTDGFLSVKTTQKAINKAFPI